jgi:colicin import membrane protein
MTSQLLAKDTGMGVSFIVSAVIHLTVFLLVVWHGSQMPPMKIQETYYVDMVNLPVAAPQAGSATHKGSEATPAPPTPKIAAPPMVLPKPARPGAKTPQAKASKTPATGMDSAAESSSEFAERIAKIERMAEARQEEAAIARMQQKVRNQGAGRPGVPGGSGREAGSDYLAYLQSRLKDAFLSTISFSSKKPEMTVRLFIDTDGRLSRKKVEHSSGDRAFEISVLRAIDTASEKFTPPPGRKIFEGVFVFKPDGSIQNKK